LADSIIYYQKLELDNSKKTIHQIQTLYNFEWSELEQKDLATEKKLSQLIQISLQNKLQIEQKKMEALLFKNEFEKAAKVIIQIKQNSEKQIALAKSQIIEDTNQRLNNYLWIISVLLIFMIISLIFLRKYYYREKQITSFRDKFYTILTHDLRGSINSLTNMGGVLGYLIRTKNTAAMEQVANQIDYLGYSTSLLLDNMLDWGTAKSYGIDITAKSFDISLFLNELVARYLAAMKTKNITIFLNIPDNLIVKTSPKCLDIIIRNLIANANTNTPIGGRINIDVKENLETQQIKIIVSDTGDGIEAEKLDFIEKVFSRKITPEVGDSGLGLGIILISHFARKNNSTLNVTSQIGVGSCFTVVIDKQ
jgi:signal transduction histidine kinase